MLIRLPRKIQFGFGALALGVVAFGAVLWRSQASLVESSRLVAHAREVQSTIALVGEKSKDVNASLRSYMVTSEPDDAKKYNIACQGLFTATTALKELTRSDPVQVEPTRKLEQLLRRLNARYNLTRDAISQLSVTEIIRTRNEFEQDDAIKEDLKQVDQIFDLMMSTEVENLDARINNWRRSSFFSQSAFFGLFVFNGIFLFATYLSLRQEATRRLLAEKKLQETNRELEEAHDAAVLASGAKGQFLADMSHEIRTPLNGVVAMASLLSESNVDESLIEQIETIKASSVTLLKIVNDVLDLSKIEANKMELTLVPTNLKKVVLEAVAMFQGRARDVRTELIVHLPVDDLPFVLADEVRVKQILVNLIGNAVKFSPRGEVIVELTVLDFDEKKIRCRTNVADNGPGISKADLQNLFEAFQPSSEAQRRLGGTGLGLSIAQRLAHLMNSQIRVESIETVGSRFWFDLELPITERVEPKGPVWAPSETGPKPRILVAEDSEVNVVVARSLLESLGCDVDVAGDGFEAIECILNREYDMILMDMRMPRCSGPEAARLIRKMEAETHQRLPIVAVTANAFEEDRQVCFDAGMDDFLAKPFTIDALRHVLGRWCTPKA